MNRLNLALGVQRSHAGLLAAAALSTLAAPEPNTTFHAVAQGSDVNPVKKDCDKASAKNAGATKKVYGGEHDAAKRIDGNKVSLGGGMTISHHRAPRRSIGLKRRGMHLALDD